jgi:hypothetical protein
MHVSDEAFVDAERKIAVKARDAIDVLAGQLNAFLALLRL